MFLMADIYAKFGIFEERARLLLIQGLSSYEKDRVDFVLK